MKEYIWTEIYRPQSLDECIIEDHLKKQFEVFLKDGDIPHLFFYGTSGVGKTTMAKALAKQLNMESIFINALL